jgi:hypothetical protein
MGFLMVLRYDTHRVEHLARETLHTETCAMVFFLPFSLSRLLFLAAEAHGSVPERCRMPQSITI